jgi:tripartite-type tricarboxylate transporter receptor subunit TctC
MMESLNSITPFAKSGRVRGLAVSGAARSAALPELPTIAEAGVPGYEATTWTGIVAPVGVPKPIVAKLNVEINKAIATQSLKDKFAQIGSESAGGTPEQFGALIRRESAKWAEVVKRSGAKVD